MRLASRILVTIGGVAGFVATYLTLWASYADVDVWGLAWQLWAIIGFTVFWVSLATVMWKQHSDIRNLSGRDARLYREKQELEIEKLKSERLGTNKDGFPVLH